MTITNQIRPLSIKQQQKPNVNTKKKQFPSRVYFRIHSVFKLDWNLGDTPCPGNLALWLVAGPFVHRKRSRWLRANLPLTARQL